MSLALSLVGQVGDGSLADETREWAYATIMLPWALGRYPPFLGMGEISSVGDGNQRVGAV